MSSVVSNHYHCDSGRDVKTQELSHVSEVEQCCPFDFRLCLQCWINGTIVTRSLSSFVRECNIPRGRKLVFCGRSRWPLSSLVHGKSGVAEGSAPVAFRTHTYKELSTFLSMRSGTAASFHGYSLKWFGNVEGFVLYGGRKKRERDRNSSSWQLSCPEGNFFI